MSDIKIYDSTGRDLQPDDQIQRAISGYSPPGLVGHLFAPPARVSRMFCYFPIVEKRQLRNDDLKRAYGTVSRLTGFTVASAFVQCQPRGLATNIPDEDWSGADDGWGIAKTAAFNLVTKFGVADEQEKVNLVNSTTNINTCYVVRSAWNGTTTSNPIQNIRTAMDYMQDTTGFRPNVLVFGPMAYRTMLVHSGVNAEVGNFKSAERFRQLFDVSTFAVAGGFYDGAEGFTGNPSFYFADQVIMCVQPQNPDDAYGTRWAVTAYWSPVPEASAPGRWMPYLHPHDPITKSRMLEVCDWSDTVVIDPRLAVVISGVNSSQSGGL